MHAELGLPGENVTRATVARRGFKVTGTKACEAEGLGINFEYTAPGKPQQKGRAKGCLSNHKRTKIEILRENYKKRKLFKSSYIQSYGTPDG